MGKKDKKKKGKGAEKTQAKTEKKATQKLKKELVAKGEEDIEMLIAKFQEEDKKCNQIIEEITPPPALRSGFTLSAHPERDELVLFGGEYFNGNKTFMYNDLYIYSIKKDQWRKIHCPNSPPPRCAHQAVTVSQSGGQLWIFGGEFASPTRSQFYHYKELWVFHFADRKWEQIKAPGGPSSRSGHRMIALPKQLIVFGGFHESIRDYKYFNDVYIFDLEKYQWTKIEPLGVGPSPRSACQMAPLSDGRILVYGGYTREKVKKEIDRGLVHTDMFILQKEIKPASINRWKWVQVRQSGIRPSARCGFSLVVAPGNKAFVFGGVHDDEENEEMIRGTFFNDLRILELEKGHWLPVYLYGKREVLEKKRRRRHKLPEDSCQGEIDEDSEKEEGIEKDEEDFSQLQDLSISESPVQNSEPTVQVTGDGTFVVSIGAQSSSATEDLSSAHVMSKRSEDVGFRPPPRMNAAMVYKHGHLYLYGGTYEDGDKQVTLSDFYVLDTHKLDEWQTIISMDIKTQEWLESDDGDDEKESDGDDDDDDEEMETDERRQKEENSDNSDT